MPANRKPRKRYRPREGATPRDLMSLAADQAALLLPSQQRALLAPAMRGFDQLRRGEGSTSAWQLVADGLNLAEGLVKLRIGTNLAADIHTAHAAMAALMHRARAGQGWTLRGPELAAVDYGLELYRVQLSLVSRGEWRTAEEAVRSRIQAALAGRASPGVTVHEAPPDPTPQPAAVG